MTKPPKEFVTTHASNNHYARYLDGTNKTPSFRTEIDLVRYLQEHWGVDLKKYDYDTTTNKGIPDAVFNHRWWRK